MVPIVTKAIAPPRPECIRSYNVAQNMDPGPSSRRPSGRAAAATKRKAAQARYDAARSQNKRRKIQRGTMSCTFNNECRAQTRTANPAAARALRDTARKATLAAAAAPTAGSHPAADKTQPRGDARCTRPETAPRPCSMEINDDATCTAPLKKHCSRTRAPRLHSRDY